MKNKISLKNFFIDSKFIKFFCFMYLLGKSVEISLVQNTPKHCYFRFKFSLLSGVLRVVQTEISQEFSRLEFIEIECIGGMKQSMGMWFVVWNGGRVSHRNKKYIFSMEENGMFFSFLENKWGMLNLLLKDFRGLSQIHICWLFLYVIDPKKYFLGFSKQFPLQIFLQCKKIFRLNVKNLQFKKCICNFCFIVALEIQFQLSYKKIDGYALSS